MAYGYGGKILHIDLTTGKVTKTPTSEYARLFIGGRGINAKLMFDLSKPGVDAFDPENPIIIGAGTLVGTGILGMVKHIVMSRSPEQVPQGLSFQVGGGSFAAEMKYAGYDNIAITGRAEKPTYIHIENEDVSLKDASGLWGKGVFETNVILREGLGDPEVKIMAIGQAGERLVRFSTIEHECRSGTGFGSIWGSKNLKAIVVRGTKSVKVYDPETILKLNEEMMEARRQLEKDAEERRRRLGQKDYSHIRTVAAGAPVSYLVMNEEGAVGYLGGPEWSEAEKIDGRPWIASRGYHGWGCCPIACAGVVTVPGIGTGVARCYMFFNLWQVKTTDLDKMFEATMLMSDYGMDNRNVAMVVSYLMKLYELGIITDKDMDGIQMEWGSMDAFIDLVKKVANREGIGNVLAEGPLRLAKKLGPEAEAYFYHSRGQIIAGDDHRNFTMYALGDAVDNRRTTDSASTMHFGRYQIFAKEEKRLREVLGEGKEVDEAYARAKKTFGSEKAIRPEEWEGKPIMVLHAQNANCIEDMIGSCAFARWSARLGDELGTMPKPDPLFLDIFNVVTGLNVDMDYLIAAAERTIHVEKAYNTREGFTRDDDTVAEGWHKVPIPSGTYKGLTLDKAKLEKAKSEYYKLRGWDVDTGWPTKENYERLGLKDVVKSLEKLGRIPKKKAK